MRTIARLLCATLIAALCVVAPAAAQADKASHAGPGTFLDLNGGKIYFEECGSGAQTVVLLHDGVLHSAAWDEVWPEFCKHFHAIRYDRRGYGRSPAATSGYYETDDLTALLRHLKVARAAVVGSSHGGEISINFTLAHPDLVRELVLVGAVVGGMPYSEHFLERGSELGRPLERGDIQGAIAAAKKDRLLIARGNDAAKNHMGELLATNPQDFTHADLELPVKPALPRLSEIHVPTLLVTGDADIPDVHAHAGAIEAGIPRSRRIVLKGVGHLMYLENPAEFGRVVISFLVQNGDL